MNIALVKKIWAVGYCCHAAIFRLKLRVGEEGQQALSGPQMDAILIRQLKMSPNAAKQFRKRFMNGEFACIENTTLAVKYENQRPPCMKVEIKNVGEKQLTPFQKEFRSLLNTTCTITKLIGNTSLNVIDRGATDIGVVCSKSVRDWLTVRVRINRIDDCKLKLGDWVLMNNVYRGTVVDIDYDEYTVLFTSERHQSRIV